LSSRQLLALLTTALIWGASFLFISVLVDSGMEPVGMSAGRTTLGLLVLLPLAVLMRSQFPRDRGTWIALAALAFVNFALPWTLFGYGQQRVESGMASIANSGMPLFAALFSVALIRADRLDVRKVVGLLLGFSGVVALMGGGLGNLGNDSSKGIALIVLATACYGFSAVSIRRWLKHVPPIPLTVAQVGFASLYLMPVALVTGAYDSAAMGWQEWGSILVLGGLGSGFAVLIYMWLLGQVGAVRASVVTYLMPPIGVSLGWLLLDESIGWNMAAGLLLIVSGVALVQGVSLARLVIRPKPVPAAATASAGDP
jgi:drug/metabolite transporter (DMT)-like permease